MKLLLAGVILLAILAVEVLSMNSANAGSADQCGPTTFPCQQTVSRAADVPDTLTTLNLSPATPADEQMRVRVNSGFNGAPTKTGDFILLLTDRPSTSKPLAEAWVSQHPGTHIAGYFPAPKYLPAPSPAQ